MEWISVKTRLPNDEEFERSASGEFLCHVIRAEKGGTYSRAREVIGFSAFDKKWNCEECIVTHWMQLPDYPKEGGVI